MVLRYDMQLHFIPVLRVGNGIDLVGQASSLSQYRRFRTLKLSKSKTYNLGNYRCERQAGCLSCRT